MEKDDSAEQNAVKDPKTDIEEVFTQYLRVISIIDSILPVAMTAINDLERKHNQKLGKFFSEEIFKT